MSKALSIAVLVLLPAGSMSQIRLSQGFETTPFPPTGWSLVYTGIQYWERVSVGAYGQSAASAIFRFYEAPQGVVQSLLSPTFSGTISGDSLSFDHAYATYDNEVDSLIVECSTDGGASFTRVVSLAGGVSVGAGMVTAPPTFISFVPTASQWASKVYPLPIGTNRIRFTAKSAFGNNLYLDNIVVRRLLADDVGVAGIVSPRHFINLPFPETPRAIIKNFGTNSQTVPFQTTMQVTGPGGFFYSSSISDTLSAGLTREVHFASGFLPVSAGQYTVACFTELGSDESRANDTIRTTVTAGNYNFGTNGGSGSILYYFTNSLAGTGAPAQPEFRWRDTTGSTDLIVNGSAVAPMTGDEDDGYFIIAGKFPGRKFRLFGIDYPDTLYVSTNGVVSFATGTTSFLPSAIPSGESPNAAMYPLWMDLDFSDPDVPVNRLSYKVDGDMLIVTYARAARFNLDVVADEYVSFQVLMRFAQNPTVNSFALVQFNETETGAAFRAAYESHAFAHLIGAENGTGTAAVTYRFVTGGAPVMPGPAFGSSVALTVGPAYNSVVKLNPKAFLEGAYSVAQHKMRVDLRTVIPLSQPYASAPWSYAGAERVAVWADSAVDWMLAEVRTGTAANTHAARRAGVLLSNGLLRESDGVSPLTFELLPSGSYYVVLMHRNHLAVMSSGSLSLTNVAATYDFTTGQSQGFGTLPMNRLEEGVFGMVAGDVDASGIVIATDADSVFATLNSSIYSARDVNLSGIVSSADANVVFGNLNRASQVPGAATLSPFHFSVPEAETAKARQPEAKAK